MMNGNSRELKNIRRRRFDYYAAGFLAPSCAALLYPVLTLFFTAQLKLSPFVVSFFSMLLPVATFLIVQSVGVASDRGVSRPALIAFSLLCGSGACMLLFSYLCGNRARGKHFLIKFESCSKSTKAN